MNHHLLSAALVSVLVTGCGAALQAPAGPEQAAGPAAAETAAAEAIPAEDAAEAPVDAAVEGSRKPGDHVAYRFSGSLLGAPLTLTQRVVSREGDVLVVDLTLEGGPAPEVLRVRMSDAPASRGEILGAARIEGDMERPAEIAAYDALMAKTARSADENEGVLGSEEVTIDVGGAPVACQKTSYRVRVGKRAATMRTLQSDAFAWGDVGGEITAEDGRLLYRAEIIDAGAAQKPAAATVARSSHDD